MSNPSRKVLEHRVVHMSEFMDAEDIAATLRLSEHEVRRIIRAKAPPRVPVVVIDGKRRKVTHHHSFRSAYRHICVAGLTDWTWHTKAAYEGWLEANGRSA
ncbi:MAG: hypothetical protein GY772_25530 [bacterium]|nr:hypothetical protein [bacterium]